MNRRIRSSAEIIGLLAIATRSGTDGSASVKEEVHRMITHSLSTVKRLALIKPECAEMLEVE